MLSENKNGQNQEYWKEIYTKNIRAGVYSFRTIPDWKTKNEVRDELLKEVIDGTATEIVIKALVDHHVNMINRGRMTIDEVHDVIRDKVKEALKNGK